MNLHENLLFSDGKNHHIILGTKQTLHTVEAELFVEDFILLFSIGAPNKLAKFNP